ncbi:ABC transporter ATP-binding protein [Halobellus captivus]|uniref:ABC transporter ATP-binding protein n=1 Tax=Halobellus captivus TaxID=2592614 RepID=UPI0011A82729|nr:ABC transporter ATP-binding protein [Halobellus captivus]
MTIVVNSLRKTYTAGATEHLAVDGIDLEIGPDEFFTLVGPSGCGKSTTLRCIAGLETPTSGQILVDDEDVTDTAPNKRGLAMMFQDIALYPHMNVIDNIAYPLKVRGIDKEERYERAREVADLMQIPELLKKYPGELSGGQRQRTAIARTIVYDPRAFLMDEPLSDLDAQLKVEIRKEIQRVHERAEKPTVYVTHDQSEALSMSDRIAVMNDGNIMGVGTPDELYEEPENTFVAGFIGNPSMNFIPGTVTDRSNGLVTVEAYGEEFELELTDGVQEDDAVEIGIRPERVNVVSDTEAGRFTGRLELIERVGDRRLATVDVPDGEIRALNLRERGLQQGEDVSVVFDTNDIHLFDGKTGDAIKHPVTYSKRGEAAQLD